MKLCKLYQRGIILYNSLTIMKHKCLTGYLKNYYNKINKPIKFDQLLLFW